MLNPTCDDHGTSEGSMGSTSDNADAYDMTPNDEILDETGNALASPYQAIWDNDVLEDWLEIYYLGEAGSIDEQLGATGSGNNGTRGVKLYDDGSPAITGSSRRLYQKVEGLTIGNEYTFSVESRSEAMDTPSEVYLLNTEITGEDGINANGESDESVDGFMMITDDYDEFTLNSVTFTATNTFVVVYVRSLSSINEETEVFYDNFSLVEGTLSTEEFSNVNFQIYPNPTTNLLHFKSHGSDDLKTVELYDVLGKKVLSTSVSNNVLDVSNMAKGIYVLKGYTLSKRQITSKIVVK
ncbi:T9SS type A sorting domain-containing protein [Formosa sp. A9]|uniref:T9SS type A sorting domain-containing protein n=1 Tax=Formosa sp. A9 TaxID=3442641 RepID=UPI003EB74FEB